MNSKNNLTNFREINIIMCKYCGTNKYRKIYEHHYGKIPKDENERTYEIHHIDGNHDNNDFKNLKAVTIQEHYDIHYRQKDFGACLLISRAMKISPEEKSELARLNAMKRISENNHNLFNKKPEDHPRYDNKLYFFKNRITNEIVNMTKYDFCVTFNVSKSNVIQMIKNNLISVKEWTLLSSRRLDQRKNKRIDGDKNPNYDSTIYEFENIITNEKVSMTRSEFILKFNLDRSNVSRLINRSRKSTNNWKLA